ncbi:MAG TPA: hypothetical protein PKZ32_23025, partial [Candidatus Melainabacteria bacterium]|nr:hypothetical protein [Candidatus Melainabacteria bacterium]
FRNGTNWALIPVALEDIEGECPYCGAAVTTALKFCANCQRQLLGSEPKGLGASRTRPGAARPLHKTTEHSVGFSSRAKEQMGNTVGLTTVQKALSMILVLAVVYGCYAVTSNGEVIKSINRVMSSIQNKPEEEEPAPPAEEASPSKPGAKPVAGAKTGPSKK